MISYDAQTVQSKNPLARFAHGNRVARSLRIVREAATNGSVLDYGCGSGVLISKLATSGIQAVGYEPFMAERCADGLLIFSDMAEAGAHGPFDLVTVFETAEHLSNEELDELVGRGRSVLTPGGRFLFSAPIEIGPALLAKEMNRSVLRLHRSDYGLREFLSACFLGKAGQRAEDIKHSHKGYDFRDTIAYLRRQHGDVSIHSYGPLPLGTWYGNSQVYFWLKPDRLVDSSPA